MTDELRFRLESDDRVDGATLAGDREVTTADLLDFAELEKLRPRELGVAPIESTRVDECAFVRLGDLGRVRSAA